MQEELSDLGLGVSIQNGNDEYFKISHSDLENCIYNLMALQVC